MAKRIYYNVPCTLFQNYLKDDMRRKRVLSEVITYAVYAEYLRLHDEVSDEAARFATACRNMGSGSLSMSQTLTDGERLFKSGKGEAFVSLDSDMYWEQVESDMGEEQRLLFLAWMALKSIQGSKSFAKTNRSMWLSRMDGSSKIKKPFRKGANTYSEPIEFYNEEKNGKKTYLYRCRHLRALLFKYYHVSFYSDGVRGFYFSLTLDMKELARAVVSKPKSDVMSEFKEAKMAALAALNHNGNHTRNHNGNHNGNLK
jgi:hypothetical protein